jgi:copper chaperone
MPSVTSNPVTNSTRQLAQTTRLGLVNRVLLGIRGMERSEQTEKVMVALRRIDGVGNIRPGDMGQLEVEYDPYKLTVMDLIRTVREQGFLAGML